MPKASIVVPAYNVEATLYETVCSLLDQTFPDFEVLVVDDGSTDRTADIAEGFADPRVRLIRQANRGLAGAHNTGVAHASGVYVGLCDADDLWEPRKLEKHVEHLDADPMVGISYSGSRMIDAAGRPTGLAQRPRLRGVDAAHVLRRNPIGNGSAPVIRRSALEALAYRPVGETERDWWFDETFRQSDDIEAWVRFALVSDWKIEGIPGLLTLYRISPGGLSAGIERQYATWERMLAKAASIAPEFVARHGPAARAFQLRYLARRAVSLRDGALAARLSAQAAAAAPLALAGEPLKTATTFGAAAVLNFLGNEAYAAAEARLMRARAA